MTTDAQRAEMEAKHQRDDAFDGKHCHGDNERWPCDASRALSDVRELRGLLGDAVAALRTAPMVVEQTEATARWETERHKVLARAEALAEGGPSVVQHTDDPSVEQTDAALGAAVREHHEVIADALRIAIVVPPIESSTKVYRDALDDLLDAAAMKGQGDDRG